MLIHIKTFFAVQVSVNSIPPEISRISATVFWACSRMYEKYMPVQNKCITTLFISCPTTSPFYNAVRRWGKVNLQLLGQNSEKDFSQTSCCMEKKLNLILFHFLLKPSPTVVQSYHSVGISPSRASVWIFFPTDIKSTCPGHTLWPNDLKAEELLVVPERCTDGYFGFSSCMNMQPIWWTVCGRALKNCWKTGNVWPNCSWRNQSKEKKVFV